MTDSGAETKTKIIRTARGLSSDHGFEGTSIRDIAKGAGVNVASVNYHFSSKEKLFSEILNLGYLECSNAIKEMYEKETPSLEEALLFVFRYFTENSDALMLHFKMMMSTQQFHSVTSKGSGDEFFGPPGGKTIAEAIQREVGHAIDEEDLHWALKSLFSHVVHTSIISNCCFKQNQTIPFSSTQDIEKNIRRLTRLVVSDLRRKERTVDDKRG